MLAGRIILLIEDDDRLATLYETQLTAQDSQVIRAKEGRAGLSMARSAEPAVILLDIQLPDIDGFEVLRQLKESGSSVPVVVITAHGSVNRAVEAMRLGAYDFLVKPFDGQRLLVTLSNAVERHELAEIVESVTRPISGRFHQFIGDSSVMQSIYRTIAAAAASRASVFITGESGTGKELCARALHDESPRRRRAFIALNCGAIPSELMEAEIFGHRKGAFTGAVADRSGAADLADGGTLFLDEIGEMDIDLQTKLLRFIQTGTYTRIGEACERQVDIRFICATNRDPHQAIREGRLREDLFYRLNVIPIRMPGLRERQEDIEPIALEFLSHFAGEEGKHFSRFDDSALRRLREHRWQGNVRELQNVIRNIVVLNAGEVVTDDMVIPALGPNAESFRQRATDIPGRTEPDPIHAGAIRKLADIERDAIESAIRTCQGNIPRAAAALGVAPSTLYRKVQTWEISPAS